MHKLKFFKNSDSLLRVSDDIFKHCNLENAQEALFCVKAKRQLQMF